MKKSIFFLLISFAIVGAKAQTFDWGTAKWNIQDGWIYNDIDDFNNTGLVLTYSNPANYTLTFVNVIALSYDVYIDDATEPVEASSSAQASAVIRFSSPFVEGHKYHVVTKKAVLVQANIATFKTDTISINTDSYSISFEILGPELVNTINVEGYMSLANVSQDDDLTYSLVDVESIKKDLEINDIEQALVYGLQANGVYVPYEWYGPDYFDGWRDADGDYTTWNGGYNRYASQNAYYAVYCIKINETADSIKYYYYDFWKEYDPDESDEIGGSGIDGNVKRRVPETSFNSVIWDWDNGDGTTTQYRRSYRCDEGKDYKASFAIIANKKYVLINATLHFVSLEDYENYTGINKLTTSDNSLIATEYFTLGGARVTHPQNGIFIVKKKYADGKVKASKILMK